MKNLTLAHIRLASARDYILLAANHADWRDTYTEFGMEQFRAAADALELDLVTRVPAEPPPIVEGRVWDGRSPHASSEDDIAEARSIARGDVA